MVSILAVPVPPVTSLYQMVLERPDPTGTQPETEEGTGSFVSVVAPELSLVSVKLVEVILIAFTKLSFAGAGATTVKVGRATGLEAVVVVPPTPGGEF